MNDRGMDWNEEVEKRDITLLEGDYPFEIVRFEKSYYQDTEHPERSCNMAKLTLQVTQPEHPEAEAIFCRHCLFLKKSQESYLHSFFRAILPGVGEKHAMNWNRVQGARGWAHFEPKAGKDPGTRFNAVKWFLPYDAEKMATTVETPVDCPW